MKILGIDPGLATIGYGLIEKSDTNNLSAIDYGIISTPKDESLPVRLALIYDNVKFLLQKYKPDAVAVEELFFNSNITTGIPVAEARGVILLCCIKECGRLYEYTPLQVKQALTGNGRADKAQVQYMVKMMLKLKSIPKPDDAADALGIAITCANHNEALKTSII